MTLRVREGSREVSCLPVTFAQRCCQDLFPAGRGLFARTVVSYRKLSGNGRAFLSWTSLGRRGRSFRIHPGISR